MYVEERKLGYQFDAKYDQSTLYEILKELMKMIYLTEFLCSDVKLNASLVYWIPTLFLHVLIIFRYSGNWAVFH